MATLTFDDDQTAALLRALGLDPDMTDLDIVLGAVTDAATASTAADAAPSAVAAAARRSGLEVLDSDSMATLRRDATEGRRIKAAAAVAKIEASVDDAISKGKIVLHRRKHWITLIGADPEMEKVLASVPNETAVPLTELGHAAEAAEADGSHSWFH